MSEQDTGPRTREGFWSIAASLGQLGSAIVGAVAVFFAWQSLAATNTQATNQGKQSARVQTLTFFATFNSDSMLAIRQTIDREHWCARWGWTREEGYDPSAPERASREQMIWFVDFFDAVRACGDADLCDTDLNRRLFESYARDYYDDLAEFIRYRRTEDNRPEFGQGMAALAENTNETGPIEEVANDRQRACEAAQQ